MNPLAITSGEPAGIGPDIVLDLALAELPCTVVVIGDIGCLRERAQMLNINIDVKLWQQGIPIKPQSSPCIWVDHCSVAEKAVAGQLSQNNAQYVLNTLNQAVEGISNNHYSGMVTAPVQKSIINSAGIEFTGHTEYLQQLAGVNKVVMLLAASELRVALATTHLPLREVADAINFEDLKHTLEIINSELIEKFRIKTPRILVTGLNPHAGEGGHFGHEEIETIEPCINHLQQRGIDVRGPYPADTLFTPKYLEQADAVLAMYHDQGLPVLKSQGFGESVNITLGLPFVRTSVDHGTALDIAGTGKASSSSLLSAIKIAQQLCAD